MQDGRGETAGGNYGVRPLSRKSQKTNPAYTPIPERIPVGGRFSVGLKCDERWAVRVFAERGLISYAYFEDDLRGGLAIQLLVSRVSLPVIAAGAEEQEWAARFVLGDAPKVQKAIFGRSVSLPKQLQKFSCAAGTAYVFGNDRRLFMTSQPHYGKAALVLPPDYRTKRIGYLVVAHQAGGGERVRIEQNEPFDALLKSLREIPASDAAPAASAP